MPAALQQGAAENYVVAENYVEVAPVGNAYDS